MNSIRRQIIIVLIFVFANAGFVFAVQALSQNSSPHQMLYELDKVGNRATVTETFNFPLTETSNWDDIDKVVASDGSANDWFGNQVAIDGNIGVVGAKRDDENSGAVYVVVQDKFGN